MHYQENHMYKQIKLIGIQKYYILNDQCRNRYDLAQSGKCEK